METSRAARKVIPQEGWLLIYFSVTEKRWIMVDQGQPVADRAEIAPRAETYRRHMGNQRVRLLHTADG